MFPGLTGKNSNETLKEMLLGMLVYGVIGQIVILIFIRGWDVTLGWWIGVLTAMACGYQMWWSLNKTLDLGENEAYKQMIAYSTIRYLAIVAVMAVVMITKIANPLAAVFGVFALKAGAYLQPLMHWLKKRFGKNEG